MYHHYGDEHVLPAESMPFLGLSKTYNTNAQVRSFQPFQCGTGTPRCATHLLGHSARSKTPDSGTPLEL